jgi:hypothetical protein
MARITVGTETIGGAMLAEAIDQIIKAKDLIDRVDALKASVTSNGSIMAGMTGPEFLGDGNGTVLYGAIADLKTHLANVTDAELADLDKG